jgi:exodeoxyribonuclease X
MSVIRVIDIETTGFEPPEAAVCEIGFCDLVSGGRDLAGSPTNWDVDTGYGVLVNPGRPIPPEVSAVHHLIDEDVAEALPWDLAAFPICHQDFLRDAGPIVAFAAHSAKFERQFITEDLTGGRAWICTYKCGLRLWPEAPSHSNQALRYWHRPDGLDRQTAAAAHRAFPDAYVTAFLLRDMLDMASVEDLIAWSSQPALQVRCQIGKWRGKPWREVDGGFLAWVSERDFDEDVLFTVRHEMDRRQKEYEAGRAAAAVEEDA